MRDASRAINCQNEDPVVFMCRIMCLAPQYAYIRCF
ncbi:unnamed protein product [Acanthoscelides obtectus]|uniref:Uncharacterized protein n=1 Tax=Acanthoscelides obtectus TaxID=200917 RepID=A0A9P0Q785_ACAOB|nr:unnamed protein product [Acanthoscelides obtectus]CAK1640486.1 hypothetical protein AOBTE_LOCUS11755 [Acanthoscelides obtectus]